MKEQIISGIDIGSSKIAAIIAKVTEGDESEPRILGFACMPSKGVKKGSIIDINQVSEVLEDVVDKTERMAGSKIQTAYVNTGGPHIESINSHGVVAVSSPNVEITEMDVERAIDSAKALSLSSTREVIEVLPREFIVDGQQGIKNPVGMSGVRLEVDTHIITANATNLKNIDRVLSDLGISVAGFVFSGFASSLSVLTETEKELGVVLVDIGGGKIDICIFVDGALSYSAAIPIGDRNVINDIAVGLRISIESAEKIRLLLQDKKIIENKKNTISKSKDEIDISHLKLPEGLESFSYKALVDGIVKPRLEEMFEEISSHIDKSGYSAQIPSGIVITGGGASIIEIRDIAKRIIGLPARIGIPYQVTGLVDELLFSQFATLVGLILYGKTDVLLDSQFSGKSFDRLLRRISFKEQIQKLTNFIKSFVP